MCTALFSPLFLFSLSHSGLTSFLNSPAGSTSSNSSSIGKIPTSAPIPAPIASSAGLSQPSPILLPSPQISTPARSSSTPQAAPLSIPAMPPQRPGSTSLIKDQPAPISTSTLESKIHSFLQGNPGFSAFDLGLACDPSLVREPGPGTTSDLSPVPGAENQEGTPVRDEGGGTPTQDEIMDKTEAEPQSLSQTCVSSGGVSRAVDPLSTTGYCSDIWQDPSRPQGHNGQAYQPYPYAGQAAGQGVPHGGVPGNSSSVTTAQGFHGAGPTSGVSGGGGWYGNMYSNSLNMPVPGGNGQPGQYCYQGESQGSYPAQQSQGLPPQHESTPSGFFSGSLPPTSTFPPPPPPTPPPPPLPPHHRHLHPHTRTQRR